MERKLYEALTKLHASRQQWVYLSTLSENGEPHVTPMFMDFDEDYCYFSLTGHRKKENLMRDPRACFALSGPFPSTAHVMVWGRMEMRHDEESFRFWREMIIKYVGPEGKTVPRDRPLSFDKTSLGIFTPYRARIYGLD